MKRIYIIIASLIIMLTLTSCDEKKSDLLILNWGDYISEDVISLFEEEYGVSVRVATTDSNEQMLFNIQNKTAQYDLVVPSDYMVDQMVSNGLLHKLDYSKLSNYRDDLFVEELQKLMNSDDCSHYEGYYVPYFWGSLGIMYSKRIEGVEEAVYEHGFKVLFDHELLPEGSKVAMYSASRDALACAELYYGYSLNTTNSEEIDRCIDLLATTNFYQWGTDDLKIDISQGKIDVALVYSGDFFDAYYADLEAEEDSEISNVDNYGIYSPKEHNNVFFDAFVIPNTTTNEDLAYKFIDFMLDYENSYENALFIGYCPTLQEVYDDIMSDEENFGDLIAIDTYDPAKILNHEGSRAEVYKYLGDDIYAYIEKKFTKVFFR